MKNVSRTKINNKFQKICLDKQYKNQHGVRSNQQQHKTCIHLYYKNYGL